MRVEGALSGLLLALVLAVHALNLRLEERVVLGVDSGDIGALPDGRVLRVLSLGFDRLVADLFWLRTVNYLGDPLSAKAGYPAVERLAHFVTDIDPKFQTVYVLMESALSGLRGDALAAARLLEKGIRNVDYWRLHFLLGFNYFYEQERYQDAAEQVSIAAGAEGSPSYLQLLAPRLYAQAGDPETALRFLKRRLEDAPDQTRKALTLRYRDVWISRDLARIDAALRAYQRERGVLPGSVAALVVSGELEVEPRDPLGGAYRIEGGRAVSELEHDEMRVYRQEESGSESFKPDMSRTHTAGGLGR